MLRCVPVCYPGIRGRARGKEVMDSVVTTQFSGSTRGGVNKDTLGDG